MPRIDARIAASAIEAVRQRALQRGVAVTVAVADAGGHLLALTRMDGALLVTTEVAQVKARTAVAFGAATANLPWNQPVAGPIADAVSFPVCLLPGGVPVRLAGELAGAVGVSGSTGEIDHELAEAGRASAEALP